MFCSEGKLGKVILCSSFFEAVFWGVVRKGMGLHSSIIADTVYIYI